jgi:3',5'-cyclic AMP phosphodiesterase CpdA
MAKPAIPAKRLIVGIIITILVAIIILVGIEPMLIAGSQGLEKSQGETEATGPKGETGSTEPAEETRAADKTGPQELQDKQVPRVPNFDSVWIDIIDKVGENGFTVIHISDTQMLSYHDSWGTFAEWLASVATAFNVKMIIHTGDIVEHCDDTTEWERANASMGILLDAGVPYTWCTGNHDVNYTTQGYIGANYLAFNTSTFEAQDYWMDSYNDRNTAVNWTYGGYKFIVINLEWHANSTAMTWFTNILDANTDANIIVATHSYINTTGGYNLGLGGDKWELALLEILNENPNVMFTLNGHDHGVYRTTVNDREQILFNCQGTNARVARVMTFDLTSRTVYVWTYREYNGMWDFPSEDTFSFGIELI